jgi:hypothetical protein
MSAIQEGETWLLTTVLMATSSHGLSLHYAFVLLICTQAHEHKCGSGLESAMYSARYRYTVRCTIRLPAER